MVAHQGEKNTFSFQNLKFTGLGIMLYNPPVQPCSLNDLDNLKISCNSGDRVASLHTVPGHFLDLQLYSIDQLLLEKLTASQGRLYDTMPS